MNDEVVLKVTSQGAELKPSGLNGWMPCVRRIRYSASQNIRLNTTTVRP